MTTVSLDAPRSEAANSTSDSCRRLSASTIRYAKGQLQHHDDPAADVDFNTFLLDLANHKLDSVVPLIPSDVSLPLAQYFCSSSHNTFLLSNQLYGHASTAPYRHVLEKGCRCVEIDVWDGKGRPEVLHGHTLIQRVPFLDVCRAIRESAFTTSDLPVVVSLEIHTNHEQQQQMVDIMSSEWRDFLLPPDDTALHDATEPSLHMLSRKILIKVKYAPLDGNTDETHAGTPRASKIIPSLSAMGIYTRACHFHSFDQAEANMPHHIFALSEEKAEAVLQENPPRMLEHNKQHLMRVYPKAVRVTSSNLDPLRYWAAGVQFVALNWQYVNAATMLNHAMFHNTLGWVAKPQALRPSTSYGASSQSCGSLDLCMEIYTAQLTPPAGKTCKPYIACELHVPPNYAPSEDLPTTNEGNRPIYKAKTSNAIYDGQDADFQSQLVVFHNVPSSFPDLSFLRLKVKNDHHGLDELLAWSCIKLCHLRQGLSTMKLYNYFGQETEDFLMLKVNLDWHMDSKAAV